MILVTTKDMSPSQLNLLEKHAGDVEVTFQNNIHETASAVLEKVKVWITYGDDVQEAALGKLPHLEWLQIFQAGIENLPISEIKKRGIFLTNMRQIHEIPMSEYALGMMLQVNLNLHALRQAQEKKHWDETATIEELHGKNVCIFGAGTLGTAVAEKCKMMGMNVFGINTTGTIRPPFLEMEKLSDRNKLIVKSDFIILLMPATEETKNCISHEEFKNMKKSAVFINMGRGQLVNEKALIEALKAREIKAAVLDVVTEEPLPAENPLWSLDNVIITPHIAAQSPYYLDRCLSVFQKQWKNWLDNKKEAILYQIDLSKQY